MKRPSLNRLEQICQKPDHRRIGNLYARRVARPLALRVTWVVLPWGISAHAMTLAAWLVAIAAAIAFALGTALGWLFGAALLQLWYLLDHVDGQLARARGTASLDGAQLDYLMHHTVNLLLPLGIGLGLFVRRLEPHWLAIGLAWGMATLLLRLRHDATYKAFFQRFKRVRGRLIIVGGGGGRPVPPAGPPHELRRLAVWSVRKLSEIHVVMNCVAVVAIVQWALKDASLMMGAVYTAMMGLLVAVLCVATLARSLAHEDAEREFAAWCRPPEGYDLVYSDGWWELVNCEATQTAHEAATASAEQSDHLDR